MKLWKLYVLCVMTLLFACVSCALAEERLFEGGIFKLPKGLVSIEEEAFEETNASIVSMDASVVSIRERAFANMANLRLVLIPSSTLYIADDAFIGSSAPVIGGIVGSYADTWAREHGYVFLNFDVWALLPTRSRDQHPTREALAVVQITEDTTGSKPVHAQQEGDVTAPFERPEMPPLDYVFP